MLNPKRQTLNPEKPRAGLRLLRLVFCALLTAMGYELSAIGLAQSVTFGLYGRLSPDYLTPTVEVSYPLQDFTLGLQAQRDALGVLLENALDLGPVGRVSYGGRASLGFAGWGLQGFARGGAGPVAAEVQLGYSSTPPAKLWVGDANPVQPIAAGFNGLLSGRYRLSSTQTLGLSAHYFGLWALESTLALRDQDTYTFGLGYQNGVYALVGWRSQLDSNTLLETTLRAGFYNRLEAALFLEELKLHLTLAYPWAGMLSAESGDLRADASYDGGWSLWLRYTLRFGEE